MVGDTADAGTAAHILVQNKPDQHRRRRISTRRQRCRTRSRLVSCRFSTDCRATQSCS